MISLRDIKEGYWIALLMPLCAGVCIAIGLPWIFVLIACVIVPLVDAWIGVERGTEQSQTNRFRTLIPALYLGGYLVLFLVALAHARSSSLIEWFGVVVATGASSAFSTAHTHEIMHRPGKVPSVVSDLALVLAGYPHYRIAHALHHANTGDPAYGSTAAEGRSLWRHVWPSFSSGLHSAFAWEQARGRRAGRNRVIHLYLAAAVVCLACFAWDGWRVAVFFVAQGALSAFMVEGIGYLQHYSLDTPGAAPFAAWNVNYWLSNRLFVNNGLHAHHHQSPATAYDDLSVVGPALPGGYLHMFFLALIPRLWIKRMRSRTTEIALSTEILKAQD